MSKDNKDGFIEFVEPGFAVVPEEPTEEMYNAGLNYLSKRGTAWDVRDLYKAMLKARGG